VPGRPANRPKSSHDGCGGIRPLRAATLADCQECFDHGKVDPDRTQPYYLQGDFDGDRVVDFAVVVVRRQDPERRLVVVFSNPRGARTRQSGTASLLWPICRESVLHGGRRESLTQESAITSLGAYDTEPGEFIGWRRGRYGVRKPAGRHAGKA
jgi:hypothetical protein